MGLSFFLALGTLALWGYLNITMIRGVRQLQHIADIPPADPQHQPKVSVVMAALNEEEVIEKTVSALLNFEYDNLEVIIVNDRSKDKTGEILESMAAKNTRLKVVHIKELPEGWLGKNHALQNGAEMATGEFLLFTDADAIMEPSLLGRAIRYMTEKNFDHITMVWGFLDDISLFMKSMIFFLSVESWKLGQPWKCRQPNSKIFMGNGKFNLCRRSSYDKAGQHKAIKMCVTDDFTLGMYLKWSGARQDMLFGPPLLRVDWYNAIWPFIKGCEKWVFPGRGYSATIVAIETVLYTLLIFFPWVAVFFTSGAALALNIAIILLQLGTFQYIANLVRVGIPHPFYLPFTYFVGVAILWNSVYVYKKDNGIIWSGTHYGIPELKKCKVPEKFEQPPS